MKKLFLTSGIVSLIFLSAVMLSWNTASNKPKALFDGKTLKGWKQIVGSAQFKVEDGAIVGTSVVDTANSFLVTEKEYADFILELEVKIESNLSNSGIQTRSHFGGVAHVNKVYGRQCEIDPSGRSWTGGIYDEDRREWLYSLERNPAAKKAFKVGVYNHIKIECIGNETKTWVNNVPVAIVIDSLDRQGFIGLQVHAVHKKEEAGLRVWFKNIQLYTTDLKKQSFPSNIPVVNLINGHGK
ncbi:MAG: DUF1080 domain-containing protein [Chitinophagaceae bacterium]|uniref:3-keto-disaccharide hydrolase n=1 Tax=unclassified Paraflavitalea TaxID=2798305 RepID=UPI003D335E85|nr:DUF1080 domain-containing protein [Chitinophagaceae bacterium]